MKVIPISSSQLIGNDDGYVIEQVTGYTMHPYEFGAGGDPDKQVTPIDELHEAAGRQCYESWPRPNPSTATNSGYLGNILTQQHYSVTEHGCITMWCDGWSRNMLLELERHQHHNFLGLSVISTRYVPMDGKSVVIPPVFNELPADERDDLIQEFKSSFVTAQHSYDYIYGRLRDLNLPKKVAREAAREILPGAVVTTFFATSNVRGWRDIVQKRNIDGAAKEIQIFAQEVLKHLKILAPNSTQDLSLD